MYIFYKLGEGWAIKSEMKKGLKIKYSQKHWSCLEWCRSQKKAEKPPTTVCRRFFSQGQRQSAGLEIFADSPKDSLK